MRTTLLVLFAVAACATDLPADTSEIELAVGGTDSELFASYRVSVSQALDGRPLLERDVSAADSRLVARLPAKRPLLIDVVAFDANNAAIGAGAVIVELDSKQTTQVEIDVIAYGPNAKHGLVDIGLAGQQLPTQDYLTVAPIVNTPGAVQTLSAKSTSLAGIVMPLDVRTLSIDSAVAPMFTPEPDGGVRATWTWSEPQAFPATASARFALLDAKGRGWIANARASFAGVVMPADIGFTWSGAVLHSGRLANQGELHLDVQRDETVTPAKITFGIHADANGDGVFGASERFAMGVGSGRVIVWTATDPVGIIMPADIGGALLDLDGDGKLDTIVAVGADGVVASSPWPLD